MVSVDRDEVKRIAKLAALALTDEEIDRYQGDLNAILDYISQIQTADLSDVGPSESGGPEMILREDVTRPGLTREQALANAPDTDGEHFCVPPAIQMGSDPSR